MGQSRLGVYGGTFNPIHTGHLIIAQEVYDQFALDRVLFIPSARPPHKHNAGLIAPEHRYAMTVLATRDDPRFEVSDIEAERPGTSYTVETLRDLHRRHGPDCQVFFIIGADSLLEIGTWRDPDALFALCSIVVVPRPGVDIRQAPLPWRDRALIVQTPEVAISSTDIRHRVETGRSIRYFVPPAVEQYIREHRLYQR
ncbi:MAG: nicotinate-nucleotide adenylyltransferase [Candidatus Latescibacteria bacterium]|nr:nicotinate-nucleotide adenylyltransferase [Candidatus Latescibacterota bacterium]